MMWTYFSVTVVPVILVLIFGRGDFVTVPMITVAVDRREYTDRVYYQNASNFQNCDKNPSTYLVVDDICTENQNLFNGKACMYDGYNMIP